MDIGSGRVMVIIMVNMVVIEDVVVFPWLRWLVLLLIVMMMIMLLTTLMVRVLIVLLITGLLAILGFCAVLLIWDFISISALIAPYCLPPLLGGLPRFIHFQTPSLVYRM